MKNRLLLLICFLLTSAGIFAQDYQGNGTIPNDFSSQVESASFTSLIEARQLANEIVKASGMRANFEVKQARNIPNAAAVVYGNKRYVMYNPDFIGKITRATGTQWAAISVLAHEIGHHMSRKKTGTNGLLASELEADEFSGYVLAKLGATLHQAQAAMKVLGTSRATRTHPAGVNRLASIEKGWEDAGGYRGSRDDIARNASSEAGIDKALVLDDKYILADVNFNADPETPYFITTRYNVVKISGNQLYRVGTLSKLDSDEFPYVMQDANNTKLYVSSTGTIVNKRGSKVGKLKSRKS